MLVSRRVCLCVVCCACVCVLCICVCVDLRCCLQVIGQCWFIDEWIEAFGALEEQALDGDR